MIRSSFYCILFCLLCFHIHAQSQSTSDPQPATPITDPAPNHISSDQNSHEIQKSVKTLTMHGSVAFGYYFTTLYFGTPPQRQTLIVDTGSTITTIPCQECGNSCGVRHLSNLFDPKSSESFEEMQCHERSGNYICQNCRETCSFDIRYSEGSSYHGRYKKDYVSFDQPQVNTNSSRMLLRKSVTKDEETSVRTMEEDTTNHTRMFMPFGCTLKETNLFLTQEADGILGLGVDTNSFGSPPNVIDFLHMTNSSVSNSFSICMGQVGGYLAAGGYNTTYHSPSEEIQYMPYDGRYGQYRVHWKGVKFEGQTLELKESTLNDDKGAYIDSGTTLFYTTHQIANVLNDALSNYCKKEGNCGGNKKEDVCWIHDTDLYPNIEDFFATFGTFTFQFGKDGETEYEWKPEDYLFHYAPGTNYYCLGMERLNGKKTLFGGAFMKNHDVLFDKQNKRIGFIRANCAAEYSLESYPPNIRSMHFKEGEAAVDVLRVMLIVVIAASFVFLGLNLLWGYLKRRNLAQKNAGVELGASGDQNEEALDMVNSDFKVLTEEGSPRFHRLPEQYAV